MEQNMDNSNLSNSRPLDQAIRSSKVNSTKAGALINQSGVI